MKSGVLFWLSAALAISVAGCASIASKSALITAQRNSNFSPTGTDKICMALHQNESAEDAALGLVLLAELARENFNIVTNANADYILTYLIEDDSTVVVSRHEEIEPVLAPPPQNNAQVLSGAYPNGIYRVHTISTPLTFTDKGIRLYLYTNPKTHHGALDVAWQGYIGGGRTVSKQNEPFLIKTLLGYFGQNYTGQIELEK